MPRRRLIPSEIRRKKTWHDLRFFSEIMLTHFKQGFDLSFFPLALTLVAFLYSSVGHGGASGYYAAGVLFGMDVQALKPQVLVLNIFVAGLSAFSFTAKGFFRSRLLLPLVLTSIPCAFLGAKLALPLPAANRILGVCLAAAALRLFLHDWLQKKSGESQPRPPRNFVLVFAGALLGLLAGLTGVGGGIYLSPMLLLTGWASAGETAAASAWFIVLNSVSALLSLSASVKNFQPQWVWIACACLGGILGSWLGAGRMPVKWFRRVLGMVLLIAASKLF
jgi:uncharacterized membrane protein YfcA